MDQPGAGTVVHKQVTGEQLARAVAERMVILELLQLIALHRAQNFKVTRPTALLHNRIE